MTDIAEAVRQADAFHKNVALMFEDICSLVVEKGLSIKVTNLHGPEGNYSVWSPKDSEHKRLFIFEAQGKVRFVYLLVKVHDALLRGKGVKYKAVCAGLQIDSVAPLIIVSGTFEPRDAAGFAQDTNRRRNWANNTVLLEVPEEIILADPSSYCMGSMISLESPTGSNPWYCEKATIKVRRLIDVRNSQDIECLVDEVLQM